jgi:hypothetical protein
MLMVGRNAPLAGEENQRPESCRYITKPDECCANLNCQLQVRDNGPKCVRRPNTKNTTYSSRSATSRNCTDGALGFRVSKARPTPPRVVLSGDAPAFRTRSQDAADGASDIAAAADAAGAASSAPRVDANADCNHWRTVDECHANTCSWRVTGCTDHFNTPTPTK